MVLVIGPRAVSLRFLDRHANLEDGHQRRMTSDSEPHWRCTLVSPRGRTTFVYRPSSTQRDRLGVMVPEGAIILDREAPAQYPLAVVSRRYAA